MEEKCIYIPNISCEHCVSTIKRELSEIEGVKAVDGNPAAKILTIQWNAPATWESLRETLDEIGYPPEEK